MWKIYSLIVFQTHCSHETTAGTDTTQQGSICVFDLLAAGAFSQ